MNRFAIIALFILAVMWVVPLPGGESPADGILERCSPTNTPAQMLASVPELINDRDRNCIYAACTNKADCAALEYRLMTNVVECIAATNRYDFFSQIEDVTALLSRIYLFDVVEKDGAAFEYGLSVFPLYDGVRKPVKIADEDIEAALMTDTAEWATEHGRMPARLVHGSNYWNKVRERNSEIERDRKIDNNRNSLLNMLNARLACKFECMDQTEFDSVMTNMVEKFGMREKDIKRLSGL